MTETDSYPCDFSYKHLLTYLNFVFDDEHLNHYNELLDYSVDILVPNSSKAKIILDVHEHFKEKNHLEYFLKNNKDSEISCLDLLNLYRNLTWKNYKKLENFYFYFYKYKDLLSKTDIIIQTDIYLFGIAIRDLHNNNKDVLALTLCNFLEGKLDHVIDENINHESIFVYFWSSAIYLTSRKFSLSLSYANKTIKLIDELKSNRTTLIDEEGLKSIKGQVIEIKQRAIQWSKIKEIKSSKLRKYNRNENVKVKYIDGSIIGDTREGKYKKFSTDINNGKCVIVE